MVGDPILGLLPLAIPLAQARAEVVGDPILGLLPLAIPLAQARAEVVREGAGQQRWQPL
ncbi:hypothetical protein KDK_75020 [Dictyobacter kobayashii]|uniref:Uncharacterized protein n=1 Tax=Dictyobacter kobayashii TaxID=2014872 RepID=A0A402AX46_9CHLR|nr:hypothetical protein KDK_75020 [Dictyobacter kobayashii]